MIQINERTVEMTGSERAVRNHFGSLLDSGAGIVVAAMTALVAGRHRGIEPSAEFVRYLSDGMLGVNVFGDVIPTEAHRAQVLDWLDDAGLLSLLP